MRFEFYHTDIRESMSYYFDGRSRVLLIHLSLGLMSVYTEYESCGRRIQNPARNELLAFGHCNSSMTSFRQRLQVHRAALCTPSLFDRTELLIRVQKR